MPATESVWYITGILKKTVKVIVFGSNSYLGATMFPEAVGKAVEATYEHFIEYIPDLTDEEKNEVAEIIGGEIKKMSQTVQSSLCAGTRVS